MKKLSLGLIAMALSAAAHAAPAPYEAAAKTAGVPVANLQYAILHALMGWTGGDNPGYAAYKSQDVTLLEKAKVAVTPLSSDKDRGDLRRQLDAVRLARNDGRKSVYNKKPISFEQMQERHRLILTGYGSRIKVGTTGTVGSDGGSTVSEKDKKAAFDAQAARMAELTPALKALSTAQNEVQFEDSLKAFNAAAAKFGKGYKIERKEGESYAEVVERARNVYSTETAELQKLAGTIKGASTDGMFADVESLKATGSFFDGANGSKVPVVKGAMDGKKDTNQAARVLGGGKDSVAPSTSKAPPSPNKSEKGGKAPGLFGMLGSLLGGLFRTLSRVATAAFQGAVAVGKALLS